MLYINDLIMDLSKAVVGCHNGVELCEDGTHVYYVREGPVDAELTCDNPYGQSMFNQTGEVSRCDCDKPTVRDTISGKCVTLNNCPPGPGRACIGGYIYQESAIDTTENIPSEFDLTNLLSDVDGDVSDIGVDDDENDDEDDEEEKYEDYDKRYDGRRHESYESHYDKRHMVRYEEDDTKSIYEGKRSVERNEKCNERSNDISKSYAEANEKFNEKGNDGVKKNLQGKQAGSEYYYGHNKKEDITI